MNVITIVLIYKAIRNIVAIAKLPVKSQMQKINVSRVNVNLYAMQAILNQKMAKVVYKTSHAPKTQQIAMVHVSIFLQICTIVVAAAMNAMQVNV